MTNLNKNELLRALEVVKPGLANKEIIEQTTSFAFIDGRVVTYNDKISISHPVPGLEDLHCAVVADRLYKFLGKLKDENISLSTGKDNELQFKSGRTRVGLTLQSEVKLPLNQLESRKKWKELPENFVKFVAFSMSSCSKDMSRPLLTCVHINENGIIEGADSFRITHCNLQTNMPVDTFLLPSEASVEVVKLNPTLVAAGEGWIHFKNEEDTEISCRIMSDTYPDTNDIIKCQGIRIILPKTIEETLERAMVFAKRDRMLDEIVYISIENNSILIEASSEEAWFKEDLNMRYSGTRIQFGITPYLLKSILSETYGCTLDENKNKLKFEGEGWLYITLLRKSK